MGWGPHYTTDEDETGGLLVGFDLEATYRVEGWRGIAFWLWGAETEPDEDTEWSGYEVVTGRVVVSMVGDDRRYVVDLDDLTLLEDGEWCPGCGQIGEHEAERDAERFRFEHSVERD